LSLYYSSGVDAILKPLADINYEKVVSYYSGLSTGFGYFRYGYLWQSTGILPYEEPGKVIIE